MLLYLCILTNTYEMTNESFLPADFDPMLEKPWKKAYLLDGELKLPKLQTNYSEQISEADDLDLALASITPLLPTSGLFAISETCASQSKAYLDALFSNKSEKIWAKKSKILR